MWFLLGVAILASGEVVGGSSPEQYATQAECQAVLEASAERFAAMPQIIAINQKCVKVDAPK